MQKKSVLVFLLMLVLLEIVSFKAILFFQEKKIKKEIIGAQVVAFKNFVIDPTSTPTPTITPTPSRTPTPTVTPTPTLIPSTIAPYDLDVLFIKYSSEYSIDKELLSRIAKCESNFNPNASTNLYAGLFQFGEPIWIQTRNLMELNSDTSLRFNAEEAIRTAAFMVSQGHLGIWPNCGR